MSLFRKIHYLSIVAYVEALLHCLDAGTDSLLNWTQIMYWGTLLSTVFFGMYWLLLSGYRNGKSATPRFVLWKRRCPADLAALDHFP